MPLNPSRDWVDWVIIGAQVLSLLGTLLAVFLAYGQIKLARKEAKAAQVAQGNWGPSVAGGVRC
jgi:hypothetical protein